MVLFLILLVPRTAGVSLTLFGLFVIYGAIKKWIHFKLNVGLLLIFTLFIAYAIGSSFTLDPELRVEGFVQKLSLFVIPLIFSFPIKHDAFRYDWLVTALVSGVFVLGIYGVIHAVYLYASGGGMASFLAGNSSPVHHGTYFMCYWICAMFGAWIGWKRKWKYYSLKWIIPFILFGILFHVVSLSLAGILFFMMASGIVFIYTVYKKFGGIASALVVVPIVILGYLSVNYVPIVKGQWNGAKMYADEYAASPKEFIQNRNPWSGSEQRLILWIVSVETLSDHPMGLGVNNVDPEMFKRLVGYGQVRLAQKHLNSHNQYLTTGLEIGILGMLLLVAVLVYSTIVSLKRKDWLLFIASTSLAFNCLFESMLERESGIVFFSLIIGIGLVYRRLKHVESIDENERMKSS